MENIVLLSQVIMEIGLGILVLFCCYGYVFRFIFVAIEMFVTMGTGYFLPLVECFFLFIVNNVA